MKRRENKKRAQKNLAEVRDKNKDEQPKDPDKEIDENDAASKDPKKKEKPEIYDYDEIAATFKVRYMTSMEAYMRLCSNKIVQMSHQVFSLSVHDENGQTIVIEEGNEIEGISKISQDTRLTGFFKLCKSEDPSVKDLTYDKVPYRF